MNKTTIKKCIYCGQSENSSAQAHIGAQAILDISKKLKNMTSDRDEWRQQHENLLSMYQTASDERATLKALSPQGEPTISKMETVEPIGYLRFISNTNVKFIHNLVLKGASPIITPYPDIPVYLAPPATSQGEIVAWRLTHFDGSYEIVTNESWQKVKKSEPLYLAPPSELFGKVEQLNKEKAELIEYARKLLEIICLIDKGLESNFASQMEAATALYIPQPKCMENK